MERTMLTPSQLRILLQLYADQVDDRFLPPQRPDSRYADGAYRRLVQRGYVSGSGSLTPMGRQEAERLRPRR